MDILQLSHYLDNLLETNSIQDAQQALNGLQIQNHGDIKKIGVSVDFCQATINLAIEKQCQMMFVHHGAFWSGLQPIRGKDYKKLEAKIFWKIATGFLRKLGYWWDKYYFSSKRVSPSLWWKSL